MFTPGVKINKILCTAFSYESFAAAIMYLHFRFVIFAARILVKLTLGVDFTNFFCQAKNACA
jgi:hypothetical protein